MLNKISTSTHAAVPAPGSKILELNGTHILKTGNLRFYRDKEQSKQLHEKVSSGIIISASGMVEGGRIIHHMIHRLPHTRNTVLFIGYHAQGTRGRAIQEGTDTIKIHGQMVPVRAKIENISGFSAHADYNEAMAWLMGFNRPPLKTFIVHGEREASSSMADRIRRTFGWEVVMPSYNETFTLDL